MSKRRAFLINTALGSLGAGLVRGSTKSISKTKDLPLACDKTTEDYFGAGPFYTDQPPLLVDNLLASESEAGERLIISGRVLNLDCGEFIQDTIIDIWHADDAGAYDNEGYNLRGYIKSNAQGFYLFETILPGKYLNGNDYRPSHIHLKITPPGFSTLTTQLYFEGDDKIPGDRAASITSGDYDASNRIISITKNAQDKLEGLFDIVINGEGMSVGVQDLHLDNGMIYKTLPNPIDQHVDIHYGVFKSARVGLVVYSLAGEQVAILKDELMPSGKYIASWRPDNNLSGGPYFIAIKINELQVHYLKVIKT